MGADGRPDAGQATVEIALLLPLVMLLLLGVIQVAVVATRQVAVTHAAREAARAAAAAGGTDGDGERAGRAATSLDPARLEIVLTHDAGSVRATVTFRDPTDVPLVGPLVPDLDLVSSVSFREEPNG